MQSCIVTLHLCITIVLSLCRTPHTSVGQLTIAAATSQKTSDAVSNQTKNQKSYFLLDESWLSTNGIRQRVINKIESKRTKFSQITYYAIGNRQTSNKKACGHSIKTAQRATSTTITMAPPALRGLNRLTIWPHPRHVLWLEISFFHCHGSENCVRHNCASR